MKTLTIVARTNSHVVAIRTFDRGYQYGIAPMDADFGDEENFDWDFDGQTMRQAIALAVELDNQVS